MTLFLEFLLHGLEALLASCDQPDRVPTRGKPSNEQEESACSDEEESINVPSRQRRSQARPDTYREQGLISRSVVRWVAYR